MMPSSHFTSGKKSGRDGVVGTNYYRLRENLKAEQEEVLWRRTFGG
jgi:hypothetical protein